MIKAEWTSNDALSAEQTTQTNAPNALNALDYISRREAVSAISDLLMLELNGKRLPTWNEVYRAINAVPSAQPEQRWIPVTERLPEAGIRYQVTFESGEVGYADFRNKIFFYDGSAKENVWEIDRYYEDDGEVIAWMPLPEPYRKETEDE